MGENRGKWKGGEKRGEREGSELKRGEDILQLREIKCLTKDHTDAKRHNQVLILVTQTTKLRAEIINSLSIHRREAPHTSLKRNCSQGHQWF